MRIIKHMIVVLIALFMILGIPALYYLDIPAYFSDEDATSSATIDLPDQPSGIYYVVINKEHHKETQSLWEDFFSGKDTSVILEDIHCIAADQDINALIMGDILKARLPENQMKLREENITLTMSKLDAGSFDTIIISKDVADVQHAELPFEKEGFSVIELRGE